MEMRSREAAEKRALAGGKDGGEVGGFDAGRAVPDAVFAAVHSDQAAAPQPSVDLPGSHSGSEELRACYDPMRGTRNPRQFLVDRPALRTHTVA
jgi:hypothetical protein